MMFVGALIAQSTREHETLALIVSKSIFGRRFWHALSQQRSFGFELYPALTGFVS
jgi:hypothetical protein